MELGLRFTELTCWEKTGHVTVTHEETMETAIAEYCPDMTRIVTACGQVLIRERTSRTPVPPSPARCALQCFTRRRRARAYAA